jgi:hypothetical protein
MAAAAAAAPERDTLEKTVIFLQKREGIDKARPGRRGRRRAPPSAVPERGSTGQHVRGRHTAPAHHAPNPIPAPQALKIIRYTSRLIAALSPEGSEARERFDRLQASVGTSRWAGRGPTVEAATAGRDWARLRGPARSRAGARCTCRAAAGQLSPMPPRPAAPDSIVSLPHLH